MGRQKEIAACLIIDVFTVNLTWYVYYLLRVQSGLIEVSTNPEFWTPLIVVYLFWMVVFVAVGLYRPWYAASRLDELTLLFKTVTFGCLVLFFVIFVDDQGRGAVATSRLLIALYWAMLLAFTGTGRLALRSIQRNMLIAGIGNHNTLIVGSAAKSRGLYDEVLKYPALGYRVKGFASVDKRRVGSQYKGVPVLGSVEKLPEIILQEGIKEVLIALDSTDHNRLLEIIRRCNGHSVGLKIMPDLYDIITGQARTNQIHGFPLIEVTPQIMAPWEEATKRVIDVIASSLVLVAGMPLWFLIAGLIKSESRGPVLYRQQRVGRDGALFDIIKFRSMRQDAEIKGPQWAGKKDPRITRIGKMLRQLHLDEIPQMFNILRGHMSLVGPRPERPVFVQQLSQEIPLYTRRLKVRPGITGWAQVKLKYDESIEDVRKKVEYDLYYIENMSLRMDFKILFNTINHMLRGRGR